MQIDLSSHSVELLRSLTADGSDPREVVEAAIAFLAHQRAEDAKLRCVDPATGLVLSDDQLRDKVQQGFDDIEAGRFVEFTSDAEVKSYLEELKQHGRQGLAGGGA